MFGKNAKADSPFISWMEDFMIKAMSDSEYHVSCANEIKPMLKKFLKKSINAKVDWENGGIVRRYILNITEAVSYLAENTRNYEKMSKEDVNVFYKFFKEFDDLRAEAINVSSNSEYIDYLDDKINCIAEILCKNHLCMSDSREKHKHWRDGMIFQNYNNLWKIIHRLNTQWDELCSRGFSLSVFYDYWKAFKYDRINEREMSEEEKFKTFMAILDGKMKFIPVYRHEYRQLGVTIVDNDFDDEIVYSSDTRNYKSHRMIQVKEEATPCSTTE